MTVIGIDVGGTTIKGAAVTSEGKMFKTFTVPVSKYEKGVEVMERLAQAVNDYIATYKDEIGTIEGIGMGIPGVIDSKKGVVCASANLPLWTDLKVKEIIEKLTGLPVKVSNDANAAALGEVRFGAGDNCETAIMLTLGTGVGCGVVLNGQLFEGNEGKGAELGHSTLILGGRKCGCGRKGCFEAYASASGLIYDTEQMIEKHPESKMKKIAIQFGKVNGRVAFKAAREYEDPWAIKVVDQYISYLGEGLLNICNIFRPNLIILSGGVANEGDYLIERVQEYIKERDYGYKNSPEVKVVQGKLGYDSGKIGAAALFF
ncbi:MAG: ROK family protein [Bacilli bacterium]|nr:ROK family protein [Bacilli bacterium]